MGNNRSKRNLKQGFLVAFVTLLILSFQNCRYSGFTAGDSDLPSTEALAPTSSNYLSGAALYQKNCQSCHGELNVSTKSKADAQRITLALGSQPSMLGLQALLSTEDIRLIALALQGPVAPAPTCDSKVVGNLAAHRLSHEEYNNVIRDLTGIDSKPASKFPEDPYNGFFNKMSGSLGVDQTLLTMYFDSALKTLDQAFATARGNIVTCNPATLGERPCAQKVIQEFGLKAFRRPLTGAETQKYLTLFDRNRQSYPAGSAGSAFDESLKGVLQAQLISTKFIYRIIEMPSSDPNLIKTLTPYEVASRLSFFLWGSFPDATLFSLAASGQILEKTVLQAQVDRMLKDPKAKYLVDVFAVQWLKLQKLADAKPDAAIYPAFNESIRNDMLTESKMLLSDIIQKDGSPYLILNADYTYINSTLGMFYGLGGASSSAFTKVSLANTPRIGMLTHGSVLTTNSRPSESSIVHRGLWALERILCTPVGTAPPDAMTETPIGGESTNPRLSLAAHTANPKCASCHSQIDPAGFGLENFDGIGRFRTRYRNGDVIDASGNFPGGATFTDARQLSEVVVKDVKFRSCYSRSLMTFGLGRVLTPTDTCAADVLGAQVVTPTSKFSDFVKQIVTSDQFLKQKGGL